MASSLDAAQFGRVDELVARVNLRAALRFSANERDVDLNLSVWGPEGSAGTRTCFGAPPPRPGAERPLGPSRRSAASGVRRLIAHAPTRPRTLSPSRPARQQPEVCGRMGAQACGRAGGQAGRRAGGQACRRAVRVWGGWAGEAGEQVGSEEAGATRLPACRVRV